MPSPITPTKRGNRRSRQLSGQVRPMQRQIPVQVVDVTAAGDDLTIEFNQPVAMKGIPQFLKNGTIAPIAANMTSPTVLVLTYPTPVGPPVPATNFLVPAEDPAIRSVTGGFVTPTTVDV